MVMQVNGKRGHDAEADQYETGKSKAPLFIFEQTHVRFMRNRSDSCPGNPEPTLISTLDGMKLFRICKYGRIIERTQERKGASSLKGRRVDWLIPQGGEDPSLARGVSEDEINRSNLQKN